MIDGRELARMAARALRAHRGRSALTVSSITLGAFSIVLMSSLATSGLTTLVRDIEELGGGRIVMIAPKKPERVRGAPAGELTRRDQELVFAAVPHVEAATAYAGLGRKELSLPSGEVWRTDLVAADPAFFRVLGLRLAAGRLFTAEEDRSRARVCVVGWAVADKVFKGHAVGRWMTVDGERCEVVGQLAKVSHWDVNFDFDWLDLVVMPMEAAAETRPQARADATMQLRTDGVASNDIVKRVANAILADRHRGVDDYQIWDFNAFMSQFAVIFAVMEAVVGLIAGIALLVGGIGVMNMMLVSVSERTREIGIRKALGASPREIERQFLWEAGMLAGSGGTFGAALGVAAALAANFGIHRLQPLWLGEVSIPAVVISLSVSLGIGVSFGLLPARRAARLDPVEAMRR